MALSAGNRVGPYEILAPLGAGGMGEVHKARDTRLDRIVTIKTVNGPFSERFEREARAISALNHPHICALHDIGEAVPSSHPPAPSPEPVRFLVMEYVEGAALKGPLPLDQALKYAPQICDALDAAHRKGIVHRDLKPDNILLTKAGVKLLDFGLAKDVRPAGSSGPGGSGRSGGSSGSSGAGGSGGSDAELAATKALTGAHVILGTPQYMAPEQIEGRDADARTDLFAFGCVLYELLAGQKAFEGKTPSSTIAAILATEPRPQRELQPVTPPALERVVKRCLVKDPDDRWQTARDLRAELEWTAKGGTAPEKRYGEAFDGEERPGSENRPGSLAALAIILAVALWAIRRTPSEAPSAVFEILPPTGERLFDNPVVSPDGRSIASLSSDQAGRSSVIIRQLDSLAPRKLAGTEGADVPSRSPDSRYLVFPSNGTLKKIDATGGPPQTLCDFSRGSIPFTAWSPDGVILFTRTNQELWKVGASGGVPERLTTLDPERHESRHSQPQFLSDGRHFLYLAESGLREKNATYAGSLDSKDRTLVLAAPRAAFLARGPGAAEYLLFERDGALLAQAFDPRGFRLTGETFMVVARVGFNEAHPYVRASNTSVLAYASVDGRTASLQQMAWFDRSGKHLGDVGAPGSFSQFSLSPDDKRLAIVQRDNDNLDIWAWDLAHEGIATRFTFHPARDESPIWSADGSRIVFSSLRDGPQAFYEKPTSGIGAEQPVSTLQGVPLDWSRDGRHLLYRSGNDLFVLTDGRATPFAQTPFAENHGQFSPDGMWIAYSSDEGRRTDVFVQSFPAGAKFQISAAGGSQPRWRRGGKELFYVALDGKMMAVPIATGASFERGAPVALFETRFSATSTGFSYAVSGDGQRFFYLRRSAEQVSSPPVTVVTNWLAGFRK